MSKLKIPEIKDANPAIPLPKRGGFLSVQASEFHYCHPKHNQGPYFSYEVAYFTEGDDWGKIPELGPNSTDDVYGYVDKYDVCKLLESEGFSPSQIRKLLPDE